MGFVDWAWTLAFTMLLIAALMSMLEKLVS